MHRGCSSRTCGPTASSQREWIKSSIRICTGTIAAGTSRTARGAPRPTFSNARYVTQQADWDFFTREENLANFPYIEPQVLSLHDMGRLDLMSGEWALTSELTALPTRGHTPGHVSVLISSAGEHAVLLGDIAHHPAQYTEDSWNSFIDVEPEFSLETRRDMLRRIEADGLVMIAGHFPHPGFGQLVRVEGRRYWRAL